MKVYDMGVPNSIKVLRMAHDGALLRFKDFKFFTYHREKKYK